MKACPGCGTLNEEEKTFCINCGEKIEGRILFCSYCGNKIVSSNKFCKLCGKEVKRPSLFVSDSKIREPASVSVKKITPENTQVRSNQVKSNKKLIVTLSVFGSVLFLGLIITLILVFGWTSSPSYDLSPDQEKLISSFGYPGEYVIIFDRENSKRVDMWMYPELERYFMFENGIYAGGKETIHPDLKKDDIDVKPEEFTMDMKIDDVIKVVGIEAQKNIDDKLKLTGLSFYEGLLTVAFNEKEEIVNITRTKEIN